MPKITFGMYIILLIFITFSNRVVLGDKISDSSFVIRVTDNLMSAKVKDIPLKKVLMKITNHIPVKFVFLTPSEEFIMANFSSLPIEKGLKRLLQGYNYAFIYDPEENKSSWSGIRKVIIISKMADSQNRRVEPILPERVEPILTYPEKPSLESLRETLNDKNSFVRIKSIYSLAEMKDARNIDLLAGVLHNDYDKIVRIIAAEAMARIGSEAAIDSLAYALHDKEVDVRLSAVEALGAIGGLKAIQFLEGSLSDDKVSEFAAVELKRLKGK